MEVSNFYILNNKQDALAPRLGAASGLDLANLAWGLAMGRAPLRPGFMDAFTVRIPCKNPKS